MRGRQLCLIVAVALAASTAYAQPDPTRADKPWLGVVMSGAGMGVLIAEVLDGTPAAACGLRSDDEIVAIDGTPTPRPDDLIAVIQSHQVGDRVTLVILRDGELRETTAVLEAELDRGERLHRALHGKSAPDARLVRLGDTDAEAFDLISRRGKVVVLAVFSTRCDGCAAALAPLAALAGRAGVEVLAATPDVDPAVRAYLQRSPTPLTVVRETGTLLTRYTGPARPGDRELEMIVLVIDASGTVRYTAAGPGDDNMNIDAAIFTAERLARARR